MQALKILKSNHALAPLDWCGLRFVLVAVPVLPWKECIHYFSNTYAWKRSPGIKRAVNTLETKTEQYVELLSVQKKTQTKVSVNLASECNANEEKKCGKRQLPLTFIQVNIINS